MICILTRLLFLANVPAGWCWWLLRTNNSSASEILRPSTDDSASCYSTLACSTTSPPKCPGWCFWFPKYAGPIPNSPSCSRCPARFHAERSVSKTYYRYREGHCKVESMFLLLSLGILWCSHKVCRPVQLSGQSGYQGGLVYIVVCLGAFHMLCKHSENISVVVCRG
jgi:hypothetical protein